MEQKKYIIGFGLFIMIVITASICVWLYLRRPEAQYIGGTLVEVPEEAISIWSGEEMV